VDAVESRRYASDCAVANVTADEPFRSWCVPDPCQMGRSFPGYSGEQRDVGTYSRWSAVCRSISMAKYRPGSVGVSAAGRDSNGDSNRPGR
jgi:hypothetical protein